MYGASTYGSTIYASVSDGNFTVVDASLATASGSAFDATIKVQVNTDVSVGTGIANNPGGTVAAPIQAATGVGAAYASPANVQPNADFAAGSGSAFTIAQPIIDTRLSVISVIGTANDATAQTSPDVHASATLALGSGTANNATCAVKTSAETIAASGVASAAIASLGVLPGLGSGTGSANVPFVAVSPTATAIDIVGVAENATAVTLDSGDAEVDAQAATGVGAAYSATCGLQVSSMAASAIGTANNATIKVSVYPSVATGVGIATLAGRSFKFGEPLYVEVLRAGSFF